MKPITICSLVTLSLAALSLRTEAASAPDAHPAVAAVRSEGSEHPYARSAEKVAASNAKIAHHEGATTAFATTASQAAPVATDGARVLSPRDAARFHQATAAASRHLSQEMRPINLWATDVKAASDASMVDGIPPYGATGLRLSNFKRALKIAAADILIVTGRINKNTVRLVIEHDVNKAAALCQEIRVDALHLAAVLVDLRDYGANDGSLTTENKAEIALLLRRAGIIKAENEGPVRYHLQRLATMASRYAQDFQTLSATTVTGI